MTKKSVFSLYLWNCKYQDSYEFCGIIYLPFWTKHVVILAVQKGYMSDSEVCYVERVETVRRMARRMKTRIKSESIMWRADWSTGWPITSVAYSNAGGGRQSNLRRSRPLTCPTAGESLSPGQCRASPDCTAATPLTSRRVALQSALPCFPFNVCQTKNPNHPLLPGILLMALAWHDSPRLNYISLSP